MGGLTENGLINLKNKSHSVTAQIVAPDSKPADGVILAQGGLLWGVDALREGWGLLTYFTTRGPPCSSSRSPRHKSSRLESIR